jgi:TldD protein
MTGVLAHEAIGHACEADYILRDASVLTTLCGHEIADQLVTIVDDPTVNNLFGSYFYDAEGVRAEKTVLVQNGILERYLHSRHTAELVGDEPTGNARAYVTERPIVRMSNTFFDKGSFSEEEIMDVEYGLLAKGMKGGSVTTEDGNFQFACEEGYIIRNGEISDCIRDLTIVGNILDFLKNVDAIGKDVKFNAGMCGKDGKLIPVSSGGPMIRIRDVVVGGR